MAPTANPSARPHGRSGFRHGVPEHRHTRRHDQAGQNIDERSPPQQTGEAEQKCQDYNRVDCVRSEIAVGMQEESDSCGQGRKRRVLMKESVNIRRDPMARRCVQPLGGGEEIGDVVVERRNGEPAELLRQPKTQGCGDRGKDQGEANNGNDPASLMRQSLAGSNQKIKPRRGKRIFMNDSIHDDLTAFPSAIFPEKHPQPTGLASTLPGRSWDEKEPCCNPA